MVNNISTLCKILEKVAREYRAAYDEADKRKKEQIALTKRVYRREAPEYRQALDAANSQFDLSVSIAQREFADTGYNALEDLRMLETQRIKQVKPDSLEIIQQIADISMSSRELRVMMDAWGKDYWTQRLFAKIAKKNAITDVPIAPDFDTRMGVLDQLEKQVADIVAHYPDGGLTGPYRDEVRYLFLSPGVLRKAEALYSGEVQTKTEAMVVEEAMDNILQKNGNLEKSFAISRALKNVKGETRNLLLCSLAENANRIPKICFELSESQQEVDEFAHGKAEEYLLARAAINRIRESGDSVTARRIVREYESNEFMEQLIEDAREKDRGFAELLPNERNLPYDAWIRSLQSEFLETHTGGAVSAGGCTAIMLK